MLYREIAGLKMTHPQKVSGNVGHQQKAIKEPTQTRESDEQNGDLHDIHFEGVFQAPSAAHGQR